MTLRVKLLLAQGPLAAALALVGIVATSNIASLGRHSEAILKDNYRSVLAAQRMKDAIERLQDLPATALLRGSTPPDSAAAAGYRQRFEDELRVQEGNITEPGEVKATAQLRQTWQTYQQRFDQVRSEPDPDRARAAFLDDLAKAFTAVIAPVDAILVINQDAIVQKSERATTVAERMSVITLLVSLAALLIGGLASITLTSRLLQPLALLSAAVRRIGEGDFNARVEITGRDELAQLATTINGMAARLGQYRSSSLGELLLAQQASQAAIDSLPDPVVVFDLNGNVLTVNQAAETLLGLGMTAGEVVPAVRDVLERVRGHVLGGKGPYVPKGFDEAVQVASAEGERSLLPRATPVYAESGSIAGATVVFQDVTRLRRVDELRNDLVATVAHEFRTPLTSLRMAIHMCLEQAAGPLTEQQADLLYTAREDCERLQSMVDELLDLARIQGGRIDLHRRPIAPALLVAAAVDASRKPAEERHIILQSAVLPDLPEVPVDRERVQLVLSNLLNNAIRHTPAGGSIEVRALPADGLVRFEVADTGEGVPKDYRRTVFEKFARVPSAKSGGAGLGLSIAKDIVEAHGGEISVQDTPGGGATFWFTVPTVTAAEPGVPQPTQQSTAIGP